jgi:pimeloyl-ACP methyl ester carboxylesterase
MRDLTALVAKVHVVIDDHTRDTNRVQPETRYAISDGHHIAYQIVGEGPPDLVFGPPFITHVELFWEEPRATRFLGRLASFSRLILYDKRGTGLSDSVSSQALPMLEERMDDLGAVMDAAGAERAALLGSSEAGMMAMLFAATFPERVSALILHGAYPRALRDADFPEGWLPAERAEDWIDEIGRAWSEGRPGMGGPVPPKSETQAVHDSFERMMRLSATPGAASAIGRLAAMGDVRDVLPAIRCPTLVLVREGDENAPASRYLAEHINGAKYVELPGDEHFFWVETAADQDVILDEIEEFLTGVRRPPSADRVLATVLFTDLAGSTERASALGDERWTELLERHRRLVRKHLVRYRGREVDTAGDGFFALFDGPARGIRCAFELVHATRALGLELRAGLHTGECEVSPRGATGIAVHAGARVAAMAEPGEVLVTSIVKDLVFGSGIEFRDRGVASLKGVPGEWPLFAVERAQPAGDEL